MSKHDLKNGLKVGDKVIRKEEHAEGAFKNNRGPYTIVAITADGAVTLDRSPNYMGPAGWDACYFDKIDAAGEYILILKENGKLSPAMSPRVYSTEAQAKAVAASMAEKNPGAEFLIFKAVGKAKTTAAVVEMF